MDIKIYRFKKYDGEGNTKAFVDFLIDDELIVKGFRLVEGQTGLFLGNPKEKGKDNTYYEMVRFQTLEKNKEAQEIAIKKYEEVTNGRV